jgi:hypothetical protein
VGSQLRNFVDGSPFRQIRSDQRCRAKHVRDLSVPYQLPYQASSRRCGICTLTQTLQPPARAGAARCGSERTRTSAGLSQATV